MTADRPPAPPSRGFMGAIFPGQLPIPGTEEILADPGPLPAGIVTPEFLAGVAPDGYHAIGAGSLLALSGCTAHAWAVCGGALAQPVAGGLRYDPAALSPPLCPECRWTVATRTGTLQEALAELADPLAHDVAAAILDQACRDLLDDDERTLDDDPALIQLLAQVSRHEPVRLVDEGCADGDHDCGPGECPWRDACAACSLQSGSWAGEREGQFREECTVAAPCAPLLALAAHFGVEVPAATVPAGMPLPPPRHGPRSAGQGRPGMSGPPGTSRPADSRTEPLEVPRA